MHTSSSKGCDREGANKSAKWREEYQPANAFFALLRALAVFFISTAMVAQCLFCRVFQAGREAAAEGVFSAGARLDELQEIFPPAGLGAYT